MKKTILLAAFAASIITACQPQGSKPSAATEGAADSLTLIGRKAELTFPEMKAYVEYTSDSTLHWRTVDKAGQEAEGDEQLNYKRLNDAQHFLNWIEQDGWTVSMVIDTREGKAKAFWSFADEESKRGGRASLFVDGDFKFAD